MALGVCIKVLELPNMAEACYVWHAGRWRKLGKQLKSRGSVTGIQGVTGKVCHGPSRHYSCLTFRFPALGMKRDKVSKNTQYAPTFVRETERRLSENFPFRSDRVAPTERPASCLMEIYYHNAVPWLAQQRGAGPALGPDGKITRSDNSLCLACSLSLMLLLHILPPRLLKAQLWNSHIISADTEQRITSSLVSGSRSFLF